MAIALVANTGAVGGSTTVTTGTINTTGANFLVVLLVNYQPSVENALSDNKGNTWTPLLPWASTNQDRSRLYYAANAIVGTGHTFTAGVVTDSFPAIMVAAFSGVKTTLPFDQETGGNPTNGTSRNTNQIIPTEDNELIVAGTGNLPAPGSAIAADSGMTITNEVVYSASNNLGGAMAYKVQTTATPIDVIFSWTGAIDASSNIASFKVGVPAVADVLQSGYTGTQIVRY